MAPKPTSLLVVLLPTATAILTSYLYSQYTSTSSLTQRTKNYARSDGLSPSTLASRSLRTVNPRKHVQGMDSRFVVLTLKGERGGREGMGDEEILASFTKGFFDGWVFVPEKVVLGALRLCGRQLAKVELTGIPPDGPSIMSPSALPSTVFPAKFSRLMNGNFMVLDHHVKSPSASSTSESPRSGEEETGKEENSYIDIAFGNDRKGFCGMHRFEVIRSGPGVAGEQAGEGRIGKMEQDEEVEIRYSSMTCNPSVDELPLPRFVYWFHEVYAERLFWDGVRGVLAA